MDPTRALILIPLPPQRPRVPIARFDEPGEGRLPPDGSAPSGDQRPRDFHVRLGRHRMTSIATLRSSGIRKSILQRLAGLVAGVATITLCYNTHAFGGGHTAAAATLEQDAQLSADGAIDPMPFEQAGQSFPGSAYYYLAADPAGASGAPLAPEAHWDGTPAAANPGSGLGMGPAARALAQVASGIDRTRALSCMTAAIYYEAASEPDAGQRAVAQVILNRVAHPSFPKTVCGVVYQGSERTTGCQFSFACDGSMARHPVQLFWQRAEAVARSALSGLVYAPIGLATHYHTFAVHPYWDDKLNFIGQIGAHRFYSFTGAAGAPAAFRFTYTGGEPLAGPHAHSDAATRAPDFAADPIALERAYDAGAKIAQARGGMMGAVAYAAPAYTAEVMHNGGDAAYRAANLPQSNAVQPDYQNSGRWLGEPQ